MRELIGKTILRGWISRDKTQVWFDTTCTITPLIRYDAVGDCCTWFEHADGTEALSNATVLSVAAKEEHEADNPVGCLQPDGTRYTECETIYGWTIVTNKGRCNIEFRNESNGYYGGWCQYAEDINSGYRRNDRDDAHDDEHEVVERLDTRLPLEDF